MRKTSVFLVFMLFFFGLAWAAFGADDSAVPALEEESDQKINDFSLSGFGERGKKTWELSGQSADIFSDVVKLKDITGKVYGKQEDLTLTAERGDFDKAEGKVHLEKDVVVTSSGGTKLTTDYLDWDRDKQTVMTEALVNIERNNMFTTATGAVAKTDLKKVSLNKDVTVEIKPQEGAGQEMAIKDKIVITCDGPMEIDYAKNVAVFKTNVKVTQKDLNLYSDIMEVYFITGGKEEDSGKKQPAAPDMAGSVGGGKIDRIIAKGNVKIERGENVSYSDEAVFTGVDKKVVLLGKPRLIFYSQEDLNASFGN
ncbi:MAG: LPS export ABC transporter periplasmic protein LptC [Candidatus Omnitrophota bacterium]